MLVRRRDLLAGAAAIAAVPQAARAQAKPRVTFISQWSSGSDGAAISGLGKRLEEEGGIWQHSPVPGFTTEMMNKLRADIIAGNPPAASQLKGPEIAVWSKIAPTVNLDPLVAAAGYEKLIPSELSACTSRRAIGSRCRCRSTARPRSSCRVRRCRR